MAAEIVVVGNEKGGAGKTTNAFNLAAQAVAEGRDVLLLDADPRQESVSKLVGARKELHPEAPVIPCVALTGKDIRPELRDQAKRYELLIIDTGAQDSPELRAAVTLADTLLIPTPADPLELWELPKLEALYEAARMLNPTLRPVIVINRIPFQNIAAAPGEVMAWMREHVPGLPLDHVVSTVGRAAYGRAAAEGLAVHEVQKRDPKAVTEMRRLYRAVFQPHTQQEEDVINGGS